MKFEKIDEGSYMLDVTGYICPHPQIYTKKALGKIKPGDVLRVIFDNPSSGESISTMCDNTGDEIVEKKKERGQFIWNIQKS